MKIDPNEVYLWDSDERDFQFEHYHDVAAAALAALEFDLPSDGTVMLKPNATVPLPPENRVVTHPAFLAGMIDTLEDKGVPRERLLVADGQAGEAPEHGWSWELSLYKKTFEEANVRLLEMNEVESRQVPAPGGVVFDEFTIPTAVLDCSFLFNVPLAKCHNLGCTTLSIKNLMGIVDRPQRHFCQVQDVDKPFVSELFEITETGLTLFEDRFYQKLCDIVLAFRNLGIPHLCMVDGLVGRDGTAFHVGNNHRLGWTLIGEDEVMVDTVGTYLMGLDPLETPYLRVAVERGLGVNDIGEITVRDLRTGEEMSMDALMELRPEKPLMPLCRDSVGGYFPRYTEDGKVVPWNVFQHHES